MSVLMYAVVAVVAFLAGGIFFMTLLGKKMMKELEKQKGLADKHLKLYLLMVQWVKLKQAGVNLADELAKRGYHHVAVYGMSFVGERFVEELRGSDVTVDYVIDRNAKTMFSYVDAYTPDDALPKVDAVIVTPITFFDSIEAMLTKKMDCPILAIDDLMYM